MHRPASAELDSEGWQQATTNPTNNGSDHSPCTVQASLLQQISMASGIAYVATDLVSVFLLTSLKKKMPETVPLHMEWAKRYNIHLPLCLWAMFFQALCHNIVQRDLDHLDVPRNITLTHYYISDIMLIGQDDSDWMSKMWLKAWVKTHVLGRSGLVGWDKHYDDPESCHMNQTFWIPVVMGMLGHVF